VAKAALKKEKWSTEWFWMQSMTDKDKWALTHIPEDDLHAPFIKRMSKNSDGSYSYYVYRNQKCIGAIRGKDQDKCLKECMARAKLGRMPQELIDSDKRVQAYVSDKSRPIDVFKKLSVEEKDTIANVYPWAVPKKSELDAKGVKVKITRDDLLSKGEKKAASLTLPMESKIVRVRDGNPKSENTAPWKRWHLMFSYADGGKTVEEFIKGGGNPTTLKNAVAMGWVTVKGMKA
jgi:hypothetical protein